MSTVRSFDTAWVATANSVNYPQHIVLVIARPSTYFQIMSSLTFSILIDSLPLAILGNAPGNGLGSSMCVKDGDNSYSHHRAG